MRVHIWLKRKEGMSPEEFSDYWITKHAPIAGEGYEHLLGYVVNAVTRVPEGQQAPYDGIAELTWDSRDGFKADMASDAARRATEDLGNFTSGFGLLFVDQTMVKGGSGG
jgi:uncharacterized protein (TIGR02118 family)